MRINEFNNAFAPKGYHLEVRAGKLRNIGYKGDYLRLLDIAQQRELAKFPFPPEAQGTIPQEVLNYVNNLPDL